ncbi:hypothetical protein QVD17_41607 [Tagetes erecta]|uniref:Uncharacterized protein n=1 Tax=Tagetes erecta TaxID=13708 RepID=A0AAD8JM54_TARER|nr:hypothetical protein QVD17_41607 [Tagetes erecta]
MNRISLLQSSHTPRSSSTTSNTVDKMVLDFFEVIRFPGLDNLISRTLTKHIATVLFLGFWLWSLWDAFHEGESKELAEVEHELDADLKACSETSRANGKGFMDKASVAGSPVIRSPTSLTFRHWAGVSPHTWSYDFAETCVFGKQSPGPGHCDPLCEEAPLLPKLRGYFAEFLRESCLAPLGILYLPTCVGFGYRYPFVEGLHKLCGLVN